MGNILQGDCLIVLRAQFADESVQCCVTSPPYWGLRDYGTAKWEGGDGGCDHRQPLGGEGKSSAKQNTSSGTQMHQFRGLCGKCGATRTDSQLGLEATPELYVAKMVEVFREVRRVLKDDGTLWLNLGDSYCANATGGLSDKPSAMTGGRSTQREATKRPDKFVDGLKPKDLVGIPWRVAFALQADGWYLRSDIIWAKPNPMPESVTDRPTKSHEYLFLLSKQERYYYDAAAIAEPVTESSIERLSQSGLPSQIGSDRVPFKTNGNMKAVGSKETRNKRTVWTVATQPYSEAHFATFPQKLIEPCILAGCPSGGLVLDPFSGSGTTIQVAQQLGRQGVGIELNAEYIALAEKRTAQKGFIFG